MREDTRMASWLSSFRVDNRVVICTITRGEILFGLGRLAQGRRRAELEAKAQQLFAALPCAYLQRCCLAHSRTWRTHCVLRMRNRSSKKRVATSAVSGERAVLEAVST